MDGIYSDKEEECLYISNVERMDPVGTTQYAEKANAEQVNPESMRNTCIWSRSGIQSNQSRFQVIRFTNNNKGQIREPVGDEVFMAYSAERPVI